MHGMNNMPVTFVCMDWSNAQNGIWRENTSLPGRRASISKTLMFC